MNVLPAIERELRAEARHSFTYWLRTIGAAALLGAAILFAANGGRGFPPNSGGILFAALNNILFFSIWIFVPLVTADCISRERREGTLGLLFLTPLRAGDIVLAKGLVHGLRAAAFGLAVLPVLMLPILMGGVGKVEVTLAVLTNFSAFCWALGAGLLASSRCKVWARSIILAGVLGILFFLLFCIETGGVMIGSLSIYLPAVFPNYLEQGFSLMAACAGGLGLASDISELRTYLLSSLPRAGQISLVWGVAGAAVLSSLILGGVIVLAAGNVRRDWQESPSARMVWVLKTFCSPVIMRSFFQKWLGNKLARNPIGWLEQRTWSSRLVTWGWLAVMISYLTAVLGQMQFLHRDFLAIQVPIGFLLAGSIAISAAGSFRRERETGAMELILVTPLSVGQIVGGRLRGLWGQFLPAAVLFLGSWLYMGEVLRHTSSWDSTWRQQLDRAGLFVVAFAALPVIGLYCSLRFRNFLSALIGTLLLGVVIPMALPMLGLMAWRFARAHVVFGPSYSWLRWLAGYSPPLILLFLAFFLGWLLCRNLEQRAFALDKAAN